MEMEKRSEQEKFSIGAADHKPRESTFAIHTTRCNTTSLKQYSKHFPSDSTTSKPNSSTRIRFYSVRSCNRLSSQSRSQLQGKWPEVGSSTHSNLRSSYERLTNHVYLDSPRLPNLRSLVNFHLACTDWEHVISREYRERSRIE